MPDTRLVLLTGRFQKYFGETTNLAHYISNVCANFSQIIHYGIIDHLFFREQKISMRNYDPSCSHLRIRSLIETLFGLIFRASSKNLNAAGTLLDLYSTNAFAMRRESTFFCQLALLLDAKVQTVPGQVQSHLLQDRRTPSKSALTKVGYFV